MYHCETCGYLQKNIDGYCSECGGTLCDCSEMNCFNGMEISELLFSIARTLRRAEKAIKMLR
jgi:hypothetical protein